MGKPRNHNQGQQRIKVPRNEPKDVLGERRKNSNRTDCHHVTERDHHCRDEDWNQDKRFEIVSAGHVGAHHQKSEQSAERHGDCRHTSGDYNSRPECLPKIGVVKDERIRKQTNLCGRIKKGSSEKALVDHEGQRRHHGQGGQAKDEQTVYDNGHLSSSFRARGQRGAEIQPRVSIYSDAAPVSTGPECQTIVLTVPSSRVATWTEKRVAWPGPDCRAASDRWAPAAPCRRPVG
jgi:hypothetical protein